MQKEKSIVDIIFIIAVFGVFLLSTLLVVLYGAKVYKKTVSDMDVNYSSRTALAYVSEKIHQHDYRNGIEIVSINDEPILKFNEAGNNDYCTYLYSYDGYLKELTIKNDVDFAPDAGKDIIKIRSFTANKESDSLYKFYIRDKYNTEMEFYVSLYNYTLGGDADD